MLLFAPAASAVPRESVATWDTPPPRAVPSNIPPAARGFQAALRTGVSLPWGKASETVDDTLAARNGWQAPIMIDAGFKIGKPIFVGAYVGVAYGVIGDSQRVADVCALDGFDCSVMAYQVGAQAQYHFGASELFNPWVGYGFGYELVQQSLSGDGYSETQTSSGLTFLKASFGIDYRSSIGLGPFFEVSAGRFTGSDTDVDGVQVYEGPVDESAWHGYLTFGLRLVVLP